jgi:hypothetical protein
MVHFCSLDFLYSVDIRKVIFASWCDHEDKTWIISVLLMIREYHLPTLLIPGNHDLIRDQDELTDFTDFCDVCD